MLKYNIPNPKLTKIISDTKINKGVILYDHELITHETILPNGAALQQNIKLDFLRNKYVVYMNFFVIKEKYYSTNYGCDYTEQFEQISKFGLKNLNDFIDGNFDYITDEVYCMYYLRYMRMNNLRHLFDKNIYTISFSHDLSKEFVNESVVTYSNAKLINTQYPELVIFLKNAITENTKIVINCYCSRLYQQHGGEIVSLH